MAKKIIEWLYLIEDSDIRTKAIENFASQCVSIEEYDNLETESVNMAISCGFLWSETAEGNNYWEDIFHSEIKLINENIREEDYINAEYLVLDHIRQWDGKEDNSYLKSVLKAKFAELESSRWISVGDKLPENNDSVVVAETYAEPCMYIAWYDAELGLWLSGAGESLNTCIPDYWMSIPIPPIKEEPAN